MNNAAPSVPGREEAPLRNVWNFIQRNRWLAFGVPLLVLALTTAFVLLVTPIYESSISIRVDEEQSNVAVLDILKTLSSGSKIETEMEVLQSRTLAEDVVDQLDLHVGVRAPRKARRSELFARIEAEPNAPADSYTFSQQPAGQFTVISERSGRSYGSHAIGMPIRLPGVRITLARRAATHDEIVVRVRPFQDVVREFRRTIVVSRPNRDADIVVARYQGSDPEIVRTVPNTMAAVFITRRRGVQNTQATSTVRFLGEQRDTLVRQLNAAEDTLRVFREGARVVSPVAEAEAQVGRLVTLQAERDMVDAERSALAALLENVTATPEAAGTPSPLRRLIAFPTLLRNPAAAELLRSLAEVENQRTELLNRRTTEDPDVIVLTERVEQLERQLGSIGMTYLQGLTNQVTSLNAALTRFGNDLDRIPAMEVTFARLTRQAKLLEEISTLVQTRMKEAQIAAAVEDPSVRVIDPSILPTRPVKPNVPLSIGLGLLAGMVIGLGAAFAKEHMDTRVRTREDLQIVTGGIPVLGMIPRITPMRANGKGKLAHTSVDGLSESRVIAVRDPRSPISEAYRSLRTNITFSRPDHPPKTLVFTSPAPGDGKSTSASNLVTTLAQQGTRCILVDADMRRGSLHDTLKVAREPGLSNVLLGAAKLEAATHRVRASEEVGFDFLPAGTFPPNPAELLGSERMRGLLVALEEKYDVVVIDAPPLNLVTDAAVLGTNVDGVIVVARAGVTERGALQYALEQLRAVRAPVLGTLLNDLDVRKDRYYGSYVGAGYYAAAE